MVLAISRDLANGPQDPFFTHSSPMVWEPLVGLDDALKPKPVLAERWALSEDGRTWTFTLRQGVKFSDGTPFDADAVVANMQRYMKISPRPSPYTAMDIRVGYGRLADVRKVDGTTVAFVSPKSPIPAMVNTMTNFFSAMFQPAGFAENGDFGGLPVTTGPYKLVDWKRGEYLLLERNDLYWGPKPAVRQIRLRTVADANARVSVAPGPGGGRHRRAGGDSPGAGAAAEGAGGDHGGGRPHLHHPVPGLQLQQAPLRRCPPAPGRGPGHRPGEASSRTWCWGTPRRGSRSSRRSARSGSRPRGRPATTWRRRRSWPGRPWAGSGRRWSCPFSTSAGQARPYKATGELLQAVLRPLGLDVRLQGFDGAALTDAVNRGEWNAYFYQLGWANGDPDFIFNRFMRRDAVLTGTAKAGYSNPEADSLIEAGKGERDERKRFAIYERLQELSVQDMPVLVLYHELAPYAHRDTVSGLKQRANFQPTLDTLKLVK